MHTTTFVVGTGRSGSSALSRIVRAHPDLLSLNEYLASLMDPDRALPREPVTGETFWRLLSEPNSTFDAMVRSGAPMGEFLYPRRAGRFSADTTGIPTLCMMVLPHLTDDPDGLLDELGRHVSSWPRRPAREHHEALFALLADRFGRRAVIERSGFSLRWVPYLRTEFPQARFVHLHRSGPDCAVSMSRHVGYRKVALLYEILDHAGVERPADLTERHIAALPPRLSGLLAPKFDPALIWDADLPVTHFGALWSELVTEGVEALATVPAHQRASLSYEALLQAPDRELSRLAGFAGVAAPPGWLDTARTLLDPTRRHLAHQLPPHERAALEEACAPGTQALTGTADVAT